MQFLNWSYLRFLQLLVKWKTFRILPYLQIGKQYFLESWIFSIQRTVPHSVLVCLYSDKYQQFKKGVFEIYYSHLQPCWYLCSAVNVKEVLWFSICWNVERALKTLEVPNWLYLINFKKHKPKENRKLKWKMILPIFFVYLFSDSNSKYHVI